MSINPNKSIVYHFKTKIVLVLEIGHNLGLSDCKNNKECMMNDADGTI